MPGPGRGRGDRKDYRQYDSQPVYERMRAGSEAAFRAVHVHLQPKLSNFPDSDHPLRKWVVKNANGKNDRL